MRSTGNSNLDLDFKIWIPDLQSNAKSENGRFFNAEICVLEFPFFAVFLGGNQKKNSCLRISQSNGKKEIHEIFIWIS